MQRYSEAAGTEDSVIEATDGEYVLYADHVEAMKRIAGDSAQQAPVAYVGWGGEGQPKTLLLKADLPVGTSLYAKPIAQQAAADEEEVVCPGCHGVGRVEVTHEPLRDGYTETIRECCDTCQGTGNVATAAPSAGPAVVTGMGNGSPDYEQGYADGRRDTRMVMISEGYRKPGDYASPAAQHEWSIEVAGPAGYVRFETFKGETLETALDSVRKQNFCPAPDEDGFVTMKVKV